MQLGEGDSDFVEVVSGLEKGDGVVTRANFLVDSESRLRASLAALSLRSAAPDAPPPAKPRARRPPRTRTPATDGSAP